MRKLAMLVGLLVACGGVLGQEPSLSTSHLEVMPEEIVGVALFPDGRPVVDLPVKVWSAERRRIVQRTRTDTDGVFRVKQLDAGISYIFVGRVKVNLTTLKGDKAAIWQHHDLVIVMPHRLLITRAPQLTDLVISAPSITAVEALIVTPVVTKPDDPEDPKDPEDPDPPVVSP
jgi:hypothetical protein